MADIVTNLIDWKRDDKTDSAGWLKRARQNFRFYTATGQWNQEDIDRLDEEGRPHLTIPLITSIVNTVVGHQIDNSQQIKLYPRKGGTAAIAQLGTELIKRTMDNCNADDHLLECFQDGCVGAVGAVEFKERKDYFNREIRLVKKSPFRLIFDQSAIEYDFDESGRRVQEELWMTKEQIKLGFNKSVDEIEEATEDPRFDEEVVFTEDYDDSTRSERDKMMKGLYCVTKAYWRKWERQVYLVNLENLSKRLLHGPKVIGLANNAMRVLQKKMDSIGRPMRLKIIEMAGWKLYKTWYVGEMELMHQEKPWGDISDFPIKPFYPYWADGHAFGVVDGNKDVQRYLNKMFSKEIEPNLGWEVNDSTNEKAMEDLQLNGGKNNFIFRKDKFGGGKRLDPPKPIFDHELVVQRLERFMNLIAGVDPTLRGHSQGKESGKALEKRIIAGINATKIAHRNFNRTLRKVGKFSWDAIRQKNDDGQYKYYSIEEIEQIVQESSLKPFVTRTGQVDLSQFFSDFIGDYGVRVSMSPDTQTIRSDNQEFLLKIAEIYAKLYGGPVIPPQILIKNSDLPEKDEIIEYLNNMQRQSLPAATARRA